MICSSESWRLSHSSSGMSKKARVCISSDSISFIRILSDHKGYIYTNLLKFRLNDIKSEGYILIINHWQQYKNRFLAYSWSINHRLCYCVMLLLVFYTLFGSVQDVHNLSRSAPGFGLYPYCFLDRAAWLSGQENFLRYSWCILLLKWRDYDWEESII